MERKENLCQPPEYTVGDAAYIAEIYEREKARTLRLSEIQSIIGDTYNLDRLHELVEADKNGRCVVLPFLPPKVMWSCSKRQPKPAKSFYASEIGILADMKAGCVFGETPEEAEAALTNKENHVKK